MKHLNLILACSIITILTACSSNTIPFDEAQWRRDVEGQKAEKLYEPHFKDGKYFNPWMPMTPVGF